MLDLSAQLKRVAEIKNNKDQGLGRDLIELCWWGMKREAAAGEPNGDLGSRQLGSSDSNMPSPG